MEQRIDGIKERGAAGGDLDQPGYELLCISLWYVYRYKLGGMVPEDESSLRDRNRSFLLEYGQRAPFLVDERH